LSSCSCTAERRQPGEMLCDRWRRSSRPGRLGFAALSAGHYPCRTFCCTLQAPICSVAVTPVYASPHAVPQCGVGQHHHHEKVRRPDQEQAYDAAEVGAVPARWPGDEDPSGSWQLDGPRTGVFVAGNSVAIPRASPVSGPRWAREGGLLLNRPPGPSLLHRGRDRGRPTWPS